jgi:hypothetical protein
VNKRMDNLGEWKSNDMKRADQLPRIERKKERERERESEMTSEFRIGKWIKWIKCDDSNGFEQVNTLKQKRINFEP